MCIDLSIYLINIAATAITHFLTLFILIPCLLSDVSEHMQHEIGYIHTIHFLTCVAIWAFSDGKDGSQLLSTHWLQL